MGEGRRLWSGKLPGSPHTKKARAFIHPPYPVNHSKPSPGRGAPGWLSSDVTLNLRVRSSSPTLEVKITEQQQQQQQQNNPDLVLVTRGGCQVAGLANLVLLRKRLLEKPKLLKLIFLIALFATVSYKLFND